MNEPTENIPPTHEKDPRSEVPQVDPRDLVYKGGFQGDPREIVENPAVSPQMLNEPGDLRIDLMEED